MTPAGPEAVDPHIVETWITGWALARHTSAPVRDGEAFRVDVGWPEQRARLVFPRLTDELRRRAEAITDPWVYLKVCADPAELGGLLPPRWVVRPASYLMMKSAASDSPTTALHPGYHPVLHQPSGTVEVTAGDGSLAARGSIAVVGRFVIYDRIETDPAHRRLGLGRFVMHALTELGRARGAEAGLLVATADGRALYETLGWTVYSLYASAVIEGS